MNPCSPRNSLNPQVPPKSNPLPLREFDQQPPSHKIWLTVWQNQRGHCVSMDIPISFINLVTLRPIKWLHYVSQAIMGAPGYISLDSGTKPEPVHPEAEITPGGHYYYISEHKTLEQMTMARYHLFDWSSKARDIDGLAEAIRTRDYACIFSGHPYHVAHRLIRASLQWCKPVPHDVIPFGLDDMRNGLALSHELDLWVTQGLAAVLCTNEILTDDDIPPPRLSYSKREIAHERGLIPDRYQPLPTEPQYVLQYFVLAPRKRVIYEVESGVVQNTRAEFADTDRNLYPLPDPKICEYIYGRLVLARFWNEKRSTRWRDLVRFNSHLPFLHSFPPDLTYRPKYFFRDADAYLALFAHLTSVAS